METRGDKKGGVAAQGLGRTGERLATAHLVRLGYEVLEQNFRCRYGEIDLVARHGQDLVFVEVKTRRGTAFGLPEEAVTMRKRQKILQAVACYHERHSSDDCSWRVDVVAVQLTRAGKVQEIRVYQHAFME